MNSFFKCISCTSNSSSSDAENSLIDSEEVSEENSVKWHDIPIILECIFSYLSHENLKSTRRVNSIWKIESDRYLAGKLSFTWDFNRILTRNNQSVENFQNFSSTLLASGFSQFQLKLKIFNWSYETWKNYPEFEIKEDLLNYQNCCSGISPILHKIKSIHLVLNEFDLGNLIPLLITYSEKLESIELNTEDSTNFGRNCFLVKKNTTPEATLRALNSLKFVQNFPKLTKFQVYGVGLNRLIRDEYDNFQVFFGQIISKSPNLAKFDMNMWVVAKGLIIDENPAEEAKNPTLILNEQFIDSNPITLHLIESKFASMPEKFLEINSWSLTPTSDFHRFWQILRKSPNTIKSLTFAQQIPIYLVPEGAFLKLENLEKIEVWKNYFPGSWFFDVEIVPKLSTLGLNGSKLSEMAQHLFGPLRNIRVIVFKPNIYIVDIVNDQFFINLWTFFPNLVHLDLSHISIDSSLFIIHKICQFQTNRPDILVNLTELKIVALSFEHKDIYTVFHVGILFPNLRKLHWTREEFNPKLGGEYSFSQEMAEAILAIKQLDKMPRLEHLHLNCFHQVELKTFASFGALQYLALKIPNYGYGRNTRKWSIGKKGLENFFKIKPKMKLFLIENTSLINLKP